MSRSHRRSYRINQVCDYSTIDAKIDYPELSKAGQINMVRSVLGIPPKPPQFAYAYMRGDGGPPIKRIRRHAD
jgi:hypothetical protein